MNKKSTSQVGLCSPHDLFEMIVDEESNRLEKEAEDAIAEQIIEREDFHLELEVNEDQISAEEQPHNEDEIKEEEKAENENIYPAQKKNVRFRKN